MNQFITIRKIFPARIDFNDLSYVISPEQEIPVDDALKESIARYGFLHPPILRENDSGAFVIVAGRKRLQAAGSIHAGIECSCLVISKKVPEIDVFHVLLEEIQLSRPLSMVEKATFLQKITAIAAPKEIAEEFLPCLDLAPSPQVLEQTLRLLDLESPILQAIHRGTVSEAVVPDLLSFPTDDRLVLFEIIVALRPSFSNQRKLLRMCRELASRHKTTIAIMLDDAVVQSILHHQDANPPQKTKKLMQWLNEQYMPRSTQAEAEFHHFLTAMQLPRNVSLAHTPFFENDLMTLSITFPDRSSLLRAWGKISHAIPKNNT